MDLIRKILLAIEANEDGKIVLDISGYSQDEVFLHVELMKDYGLVDALIIPASDGSAHKILSCVVKRMTWSGHDFLDITRKDSIWEQAKKKCLKGTGGLAFDILKACLVHLGKRSIGIE